MAKELKKVTKKAKTTKVAKSTKATKPVKATKTTKPVKATKTTKPAKVTKTTKKELSAKDRKKVTGGKNVNNRLASGVGIVLGASTAGAAKGCLDTINVKGARVRVNQQYLIGVEKELLDSGYSPEEIEIIISEIKSNSGM